MTIVMGIDPGLRGALVLTDGVLVFDIVKVPTLKSKARGRQVDLAGLHLAAAPLLTGAAHAYVEQVGPMPRQGVSSMFKFGYVTGALTMLVTAYQVPMTLVPASKWKKDMGVCAAKDSSRHRASQLLPKYADHFSRPSDDGAAEAALIALWGLGVR